MIYALNRKETKEASEIALKLTKDYWNFVKSHKDTQDMPKTRRAGFIAPRKKEKRMISSLWVNMTDAYIVADKMDEIFE